MVKSRCGGANSNGVSQQECFLSQQGTFYLYLERAI